MHHFFIQESQIKDNEIIITGVDIKHIKNVLRLRVGEEITLSCSETACEYVCEIYEIKEHEILVKIKSMTESNQELGSRIYLFQGLPKNDKMELIIQKSVELGVFQIIPVTTRRTVVKLDEKKEQTKRKRWELIAESAAKQSKRAIIPQIASTMTLKEAFQFSKNFTHNVIPYECQEGMQETKKIIQSLGKNQTIGVYIGPEGGFEKEEVDMAINNGVIPISLGRRILRTETAGLTVLSIIMFQIEE